MPKPGGASSSPLGGSSWRSCLIVNFSNCCRVCDILLDDDDGSGGVGGALPSPFDSASLDDLAVILLLEDSVGVAEAAVVANSIGGGGDDK